MMMRIPHFFIIGIIVHKQKGDVFYENNLF